MLSIYYWHHNDLLNNAFVYQAKAPHARGVNLIKAHVTPPHPRNHGGRQERGLHAETAHTRVRCGCPVGSALPSLPTNVVAQAQRRLVSVLWCRVGYILLH